MECHKRKAPFSPYTRSRKRFKKMEDFVLISPPPEKEKREEKKQSPVSLGSIKPDSPPKESDEHLSRPNQEEREPLLPKKVSFRKQRKRSEKHSLFRSIVCLLLFLIIFYALVGALVLYTRS